MSGLSSLRGAPIPARRSADTSNSGSDTKTEGLSSLSNAPPLGVRSSMSAAPTTSGGSGLGAGRTAGARDAATRRSTPVFSGSRAQDDDDDALFPKARGLIKKEAKKNTTFSNDSDSDDCIAGAVFPTASAATRRSAPAPGSGSTSPFRGGASSTSTDSKPKASNPIMAMLEGEEDDDFLAGLAPPKKGTPRPEPAPAPAAASTTQGRAASTKTGASGATPAGAAANTNKSIDTLMGFLKDDDILSKPLPAVDEEPLDLFGGSSKPVTTPRRGRRAGGDEPSASADPPLFDGAASSLSRQTSGGPSQAAAGGRAGTAPMSGGGSLQGDGSDEFLPGLGSSSQPKQSPNLQLDAGPSFASLPTPTAATSVPQQVAPAAAAPAPAASHKDYSLELSDGDLPGMGSPAFPASQGRGSQVPTPSSTTSTVGTARLPPKGPSGGGMPAAASKPAIGDSWELDADTLLPDESQSSVTARGGGAGGPAAVAAAAAVAATSTAAITGPAVGAASKQPSRLQHSSSARAISPARGESGDEEDEEPSGYMPSFASTARRSAPNPFNQPAATEGAQRQRRSLVPDTATSQPVFGSAAKARARDEDKREKPAAVAAATTRQEQPAAFKPAPVSVAPFRLPSEVRAVDSLSVSINSPASATPKPIGQGAAGPVAGRRAAVGPAGKPAVDLGLLESSTDDESFPALKKVTSPTIRPKASTELGTQKSQPTKQAAGAAAKGDRKVAASAPNPLQAQPQVQPQQQQQLPPGVQRMQPAGGAALPPGVQLGTAHGATAAGVPQPQLQLQPQQFSGLPPGVTPLGPAAVPAGLTPLPGNTPPPGMTPVATAPVPGVVQYTAVPQQAPGITLMPHQTHTVVSVPSGVDMERMAQLQADHDKAREEASKLRKQVSDLEATLRERDSKIREVENRVAAAEANAKISLAETQALAVKESSSLRGELEEMRAALGRVKAQYQEMDGERQKEATRLRAELEAARSSHMEEIARVKEDAAQSVVVAEARGRRSGVIEKEVAEAQLKAQQAALAEEKEVVHKHRLSADLLAQLSDKVRAAATAAFEREDRALRSLERDLADREARISAREKVLGERETRVSARERELDSLRSDLQSLTTTLESSAAHEREDIRREQTRLAREAARMDALQGSLLAEREDLRVQVQIERKLLEEAREARRKEREALIGEVSTERRALAVEQADLMRQLDASRAELLQLKTRVIEYESRAGAALQQALAEEERVAKAREAGATERATLAAANTSLKDERELLEAEAAQLVEYAAKLQAQSIELAFSNSELDDLKVELIRQHQELAMELSQVKAQSLALDEQRRHLDATKKAFDRERLGIAEERRVLSDERLAASKAADAARDAQLKLAEAVRQWVAQGVPIPFSVQTAPGAGIALSVQPAIPGMPQAKGATFSPIPSASPDKRGAHNAKRERAASAANPGRRSKNTLRHMLDKMGLDLGELMGQGGKLGAGAGNRASVAAGTGAYDQSDYVRQQKEFLTQLRMSAPDFHAPGAAMGAGVPLEAAYFTAEIPGMMMGSAGADQKPRYAGGTAIAGFPGFAAMQAAAAARGSPTPRGFETMGGGAGGMQTAVGGGMGQVPEPSLAAHGMAMPRQFGVGMRGAVAAGQQHGLDPRSLEMMMSDILDQNTLISSEFTSMVPMSATTSEQDGTHSQPGTLGTAGTPTFVVAAAGGGPMGGAAGQQGQGGPAASSSGTQGSVTPARVGRAAYDAAHVAGAVTGHLTSDLSDTALSPLALHSPTTTNTDSSGVSKAQS